MKFIYRAKQFILLTGDVLSLYVALWLSLFFRNFGLIDIDTYKRHIPLFTIIFTIWIINNYINGLYDLIKISNKEKFYRRFIETGLISLFVGITFFYLLNNALIAPKTILLLNVILGYGISLLWRITFKKFSGLKKLQNNVIFIGFTKETEELINIFSKYPERGYKVVALVDPERNAKANDFNFDIYYNLHTIRPAITNHKAHIVIIAPDLKKDPIAMREFYELLFWKVSINDLAYFYEDVTGRIPPSTFSEGWFLQHMRHNENAVYEKSKIVIDAVSGVTLFMTFVFLYPFIGLAIKINSKGPILYKQHRIGRFGKLFTIYKFRSMYALTEDGSAEVDGVTFAQKDDERITFIGKFLRKTRLDEIPQSINILKGEIGLIGPRPERPEIVEELEGKMPYYSLRHIIKPGLTGWAVLNQNYTDNMETSLQKLQYDLFYIKNRSMILDLSIILKTVNLIMRLMGQ